MKKIGVLIAILFSLVVSPALAADACLIAAPASPAHVSEIRGDVQKDGNTQNQNDVNCGHCSCQHSVISRFPTGYFTYISKKAGKLPVMADSVVISFSARPPLKPPMHV